MPPADDDGMKRIIILQSIKTKPKYQSLDMNDDPILKYIGETRLLVSRGWLQ